MNELVQSRKDWNDLAEINAAWFNVPRANLPNHQWEIERFFAGGREHLKRSLEMIERYEVVFSRGAALDFGCGIGRVTQALAEEFEIAYGVDISDKMIEIATRFNRHGEKCKYIASDMPNLKMFQDCSIDFIFSINALQHNHTDIIRNYLQEFVRVLPPGGVMLFQIPIERITHDETALQLRSLPRIHPKRVWNKLKGILIGHDQESRYYRLSRLGFPKKWLFEKWGLRPHINMYFLEETEVRKVLEGQGCVIRHVEKYRYEDMVHAQFLAIKP